MQRINKNARIASMEGRPVREEIRKGVRAYRATVHPTTGDSPNKLMFGRELRGKLPEISKQPNQQEDQAMRSRDKERKAKMKEYADKRRHTTAMKIKVGDLVLCKQRRKHSLTPLYDPVPMVIGIKGDMITAKSDRKIRTRNFADWKWLKNGIRDTVHDNESDDEVDPDELEPMNTAEELGPELHGTNAAPKDTAEKPRPEQHDTNPTPRDAVEEHEQGSEKPDAGPEPNQTSSNRPKGKIIPTSESKYKDFIGE